jgi:hypothetical protein
MNNLLDLGEGLLTRLIQGKARATILHKNGSVPLSSMMVCGVQWSMDRDTALL